MPPQAPYKNSEYQSDAETRPATFTMSKLPIFKQSVNHLGLQSPSSSSYGSGLKQYGTAAPQAHSTSILERIKQANSIRNNYNSLALSSHEVGYADQCLGLTQQKSQSDLSGHHEVNSVLSSSFKVGSFSEKNSTTVLKVS